MFSFYIFGVCSMLFSHLLIDIIIRFQFVFCYHQFFYQPLIGLLGIIHILLQLYSVVSVHVILESFLFGVESDATLIFFPFIANLHLHINLHLLIGIEFLNCLTFSQLVFLSPFVLFCQNLLVYLDQLLPLFVLIYF